MSRTALLFLAVVLLVVFAPAVSAQSQPEVTSLLIPGENSAVTINCAVSGSDLNLTVTFPSEVKSYLTAGGPPLSLMIYFDTDKNVRTGFAQAEDARRGGDYSVDLTVRLMGGEAQALADEVTVVQLTAESSFGTLVPVKSSIRVDGSKIDVLMPLSAMRLRKGRSVRIAAQTVSGAYVDQVIALK